MQCADVLLQRLVTMLGETRHDFQPLLGAAPPVWPTEPTQVLATRLCMQLTPCCFLQSVTVRQPDTFELMSALLHTDAVSIVPKDEFNSS